MCENLIDLLNCFNLVNYWGPKKSCGALQGADPAAVFTFNSHTLHHRLQTRSLLVDGTIAFHFHKTAVLQQISTEAWSEMAALSISFLTEFNKTKLNICLMLQNNIHKFDCVQDFFVINCGFFKALNKQQ